MSKESHVALYRKYRPENFDDVVGQENAVTLLTGAIKQKKVSHAYLFCGGRGTGKTTMARIVARDIGCNPEDIIEIDAASNRGIDEIRELREAVRTAPFSSPYKVYIIDEAHMLTKEAANALLKTLEEPPSHVIFILATTDPEKLPHTIVSRCQKVVFKQPDIETLSKRLIFVAESEGKTLSQESASLIARHGKGSYRDALGVLEQVLSISGKKVNNEDVIGFLGTPDAESLSLLLGAFCEKDHKKIIKAISVLEKGNGSALRTYDEFLELLRLGLRVRIGDEKNDGPVGELVKAHPEMFVSKNILGLLSKRHLLSVSEQHAWLACEVTLISLIEN